GWVEPAELPGYLAAGDVALYPFDDTLVNRTKCPAKLTELLAAGVPVVADRVGQIPEYVAPECHPLLCSPDDREGMIAGCAALLLDPVRRGSASKTGRDYILGRFSWREYAGRLDDFYRLRLSVAQRG
ncbi:glycosyltransferase, partial [bacterium]|nr:glycosyltransferase [bacterium]